MEIVLLCKIKYFFNTKNQSNPCEKQEKKGRKCVTIEEITGWEKFWLSENLLLPIKKKITQRESHNKTSHLLMGPGTSLSYKEKKVLILVLSRLLSLLGKNIYETSN